MNDVMSLGIQVGLEGCNDGLVSPIRGQALDVASTGDISFRFLKRASGANATVLDLTEPMLAEGRKRAENVGISGQLEWVVGDAMALPSKMIVLMFIVY